VGKMGDHKIGEIGVSVMIAESADRFLLENCFFAERSNIVRKHPGIMSRG
jgi:hypothetical protein